MSSEKTIIMFVNVVDNKLEPLNPQLFKSFLKDFGQGAKVTVTIDTYSREKSPEQIAFFHVIVNMINKETNQDKLAIKNHLKNEYGICDENGKLLSCTKYTEKQMSKLIEGSLIFAREFANINLPSSEEFKKINIK